MFCKITENGLTNEQKEIIEETYSEKWYKNLKRFTGIQYKREDLLRYGLRV